MRILTLLSILCISYHSYTQSNVGTDKLLGSYHATYGGDELVLDLLQSSDGHYTGQLKDSQQSYDVKLDQNGNTLRGTASENTLGLVFQITGTLEKSQLLLHFEIEMNGTKNAMDIPFSKQGTEGKITSTATVREQAIQHFPEGAEHPSVLVATWVKEELYQSGYGDNYMGAGFSESMTFLPDGRLSQGGSSAYISGSNYSGQTNDTQNDIIPGLAWYTRENQLFLIQTENGQTQNILLGKFYVEDGHLLITATNGEKLLLSKK